MDRRELDRPPAKALAFLAIFAGLSCFGQALRSSSLGWGLTSIACLVVASVLIPYKPRNKRP